MTSALFMLAQGSPSGIGTLTSFLPMILIFVIFYFLLIWPMRKRQKALQKLIENLKRGDKVITNGGLHGEVAALDGQVVHLKIADNVKVKVSRSSIAGLEGGGEAEATT
jgi:preprotein translocase subunit YajC